MFKAEEGGGGGEKKMRGEGKVIRREGDEG